MALRGTPAHSGTPDSTANGKPQQTSKLDKKKIKRLPL